MEKVTVHFNEDDYRIYHTYCYNYYKIQDATRKKSIRMLLDLFQNDQIDIQENNLEQAFSFCYTVYRHLNTEISGQRNNPTREQQVLHKIQMITDISHFLEDLGKLYRVLGRKGLTANYILILGMFAKILDDERNKEREELRWRAGDLLETLASSLQEILLRNPENGTTPENVISGLVALALKYNHISSGDLFSEEGILLLAPKILEKYGFALSDPEIQAIIENDWDNQELNEFEKTVEGRVAADEMGIDVNWDSIHDYIIELNTILQDFRSEIPPILLEPYDTIALPGPGEKARFTGNAPSTPKIPRGIHSPSVSTTPSPARSLEVRVDSPDASYPHVSFPGKVISIPNIAPTKQNVSLVIGVLVLLCIISYSILIPSAISAITPANGTNLTAGASTTALLKNGTASATSAATKTTVVPTVKKTATPTPTPTPKVYVNVQSVSISETPKYNSSSALKNQSNSLTMGEIDLTKYVKIYSGNKSYNNTAEAFTFDLKNPPMIIYYQVNPVYITDYKWFTPHDSAKKIDGANITRPMEEAWFKINISDKKTGDSVLTQGWGNIYPSPNSTQTIILREMGSYRIQLSGNWIRGANVTVYVKKEGNVK